MSSFEKCLDVVLKHEGGWSNHPRDTGGATNFGITLRVYIAYRKRIGKPLGDMQTVQVEALKRITKDEVRHIYRDQYWNRINGNALPLGLALSVFDMAVNSGVSRAVKMLQRILGVDDDGIIGMMTLQAVQSEGEFNLIQCYNDERMEFLKRLSNWDAFGKGWTRRVEETRAQSIAWAGKGTSYKPDGKPLSTTNLATVAGSVTGTVAVVKEITDAVQEGATLLQTAPFIVMGVVIIAAALWVINERRKKRRLYGV